MRVSTSQIFNQGIQQLQNINSQQSKTQQQIASGKEILRPSDDPVGATRALQLKDDLSQSERFKENANLSKTRLERQDGVMGSYTESLARARELMVQAGNGSLSQSDRESIAGELRQVKDQMQSLANTQGPNGEYLFGGHKGGEQPFQENISGDIVYEGDEGRRSVQIDKGVSIPVNDNGKETFVDIDSDRPTFQTRASSRNEADPPAQIGTGTVMDRDEFESFYPDDMVIQFNRDDDGNTSYTVTNRETGSELASDDYVSGRPIEAAGVRVEVQGDPADGDSFFVETSEKQSVFGTMERLINDLETLPNTNEARGTLKDSIDQSIANLDNAENRALEIHSGVGTRLNTVESTLEFLEDSDLLNKETLSEIEDLDYAEAISRLTQQDFVLQAAQQSFAQVSRLSLFDSI